MSNLINFFLFAIFNLWNIFKISIRFQFLNIFQFNLTVLHFYKNNNKQIFPIFSKRFGWMVWISLWNYHLYSQFFCHLISIFSISFFSLNFFVSNFLGWLFSILTTFLSLTIFPIWSISPFLPFFYIILISYIFQIFYFFFQIYTIYCTISNFFQYFRNIFSSLSNFANYFHLPPFFIIYFFHCFQILFQLFYFLFIVLNAFLSILRLVFIKLNQHSPKQPW